MEIAIFDDKINVGVSDEISDTLLGYIIPPCNKTKEVWGFIADACLQILLNKEIFEMNNTIHTNSVLLGILKNKETRNQKEYDTFLWNTDIGTPDDNDPEYFVIDLGLFSAQIINVDDDETFEIPIQIKYYNRYGEITDDAVLQQYFDFFMNRMSLRELIAFAKKEYGIICDLEEDLVEVVVDEYESYCSLSEQEYEYELDKVIRDIFLDDPYTTLKRAKMDARDILAMWDVFCRNDVGLITVLKADVNGTLHTFIDFDRNRDVIISDFSRTIVNEFGVI